MHFTSFVNIEMWVIQFKWTVQGRQEHSHLDGLLQDRRNSIANALELRLSCTDPSIYNVNIMVADAVKIEAVRASTAMVLT